MDFNFDPLFLTFKLAFITTLFLLGLGIPLAYWLSQTNNKFKPVLETFISLPLVLPPSVLGFYLLLLFTPQSGVGAWLNEWFSIQLVFSFPGLVVASIIYSLPFMVHPIQSGLQNLPVSLAESSYLLGKSKIQTLWHVLLPNIKPSIITAIVLSFAHTIGEFGVVLMMGGSIPGKTRVASIAIYDEVEALNYDSANVYAGVLFLISFAILLTVYITNRKVVKVF